MADEERAKATSPRVEGHRDALYFCLHMAKHNEIISIHPDILGGVPVFSGTRVPVKTLYDYLEAGDSLSEFLNDFPSVSREQAIAALELGRQMTETNASVAR